MENESESGPAEIIEEPESDSLAVVIEKAIQDIEREFGSMTDYYTISSRFDGYESGSESTWYFDKSLNLKYAKGSWDMEGTEGTYAYYFDGEDLLASIADDQYQEGSESTLIHKGFAPIFGFTRSNNEGAEGVSYVYESAYTTSNKSAKEEFSKLLDLIRNNLDSAIVNDYEVSIHIENVVNYGIDVTQKEDYSISKVLFDKLIKE